MRFRRMKLDALFVIVLGTVAVALIGYDLAGAADPAPRVPAYVDLGYTDGSVDRRHNLTPAEVAAVRALFPATVPAVPTEPAADVYVSPGESWVAGVLAAKPGQTVYIRAGDYPERWGDSAKRPAAGVTILGAGIGKTRIVNPSSKASEPAVFAWTWDDVTFRGLSVVGPATLAPAGGPASPGFQLSGCRRVELLDVEATGHTFGVVIESAGTRTPADVKIVGGHYADNWHPKNEHSSGIYASKCVGLVLDGPTVERNGWNGDRKAMGSTENHGVYITGDCGPAVVVNGVYRDNAYCGVQARSGGTVERNTFVNNASHLTFGLVNGNGPIKLGGVSGRIGENWFEGTKPAYVNGKPEARGYGIEIGNVNAAGVVVENNGGSGTFAPPAAKLVPDFAFLRVAYLNLSASNPMKGKDVGVMRLDVRGNAVTWPGPKVYVAPAILKAAAKPSGPKLTVQADWPPGRKPA